MDLRPAGTLRLHRESLTHVLIVGGSAARREQVARAFHQESPLRHGTFVHVDCTRDEDKLRQALAGWMTDATFSRSNPYQAAESGTLYLDPVENLSQETQQLLLALARRLQESAVGSAEGIGAGRLVAGNPEPLATAIAEGRFLAALHDALDKVRVQLDEVTPGTSA